MSHGKLFICDGEKGNRIICGSSNMTQKGFSGGQNEINIKIDNDDKCLMDFKELFKKVISNTNEARPILKQCVQYQNDEISIDELPISQVAHVQKLVLIDSTKTVEDKSEIEMMYDIERKKIELEKFITPDDLYKKDGKIYIQYEDLIRIQNRKIIVEENEVKENRKLNNMEIDIENCKVYFNGKELLFNEDKVLNDISCLKMFFEGYSKYEFIGDIENIQYNYFKLLNYMFISPFMCYFRNLYLKRGDPNSAEDGFQVYAFLYGDSGIGKTSVVKLIMNLMYNRNNEIPNSYFTQTEIGNLKLNYKGLPLYLDDVGNDKFSRNSDNIIKDTTFGRVGTIENYPACIITLNKVGSIDSSIKRRSVIIKVEGKHNPEYREEAVAEKLQKKVTNNLYLKYLNILLPRIKELYNQCKQDNEGTYKKYDLYYESSLILHQLLEKELGGVVKTLTRKDDYFNEKIISKEAIKKLIEKYQINKKLFKVKKITRDKKLWKFIYKNEEMHEKNNREFAEELPASYNVSYDKNGIVIKNYEQVREDFLKYGKIRI